MDRNVNGDITITDKAEIQVCCLASLLLPITKLVNRASALYPVGPGTRCQPHSAWEPEIKPFPKFCMWLQVPCRPPESPPALLLWVSILGWIFGKAGQVGIKRSGVQGSVLTGGSLSMRGRTAHQTAAVWSLAK